MHAFDYLAPATLDEALDVLAAHRDDAKVLAGGQSLVPLLNYRLARPRVVVDINALPLDRITVTHASGGYPVTATHAPGGYPVAATRAPGGYGGSREGPPSHQSRSVR